jgi:hypothetical protein
MAAIPALDTVYEAFQAVPPVPPATDLVAKGRVLRDRIAQIDRSLSRDVAKWRSEMLAARVAVKNGFDLLWEQNPQQAVAALESDIDRLLPSLEEREAFRERIKQSFAEEGRKIAAISVADGRVWRKFTRRFLDLIADEYQVRVSFIDYLKSIVWDHDPEARGGDEFDSAEALIADLHRSTR